MDFDLQTLTYIDLTIRLLLAAFMGCFLGIDRDLKGKPVDFRAYMIVCVATTIVAIMGQELFDTYKNQEDFINLDLGKIIAGALTGIGFLGAGAIIKDSNNNQVVGTTTGAGIWASAILGLCVGFGFITLALSGFVVISLILLVARQILKKVQHK